MIKKCIFAVCALVLVSACDPLTEEQQSALDVKVAEKADDKITSYMTYVIDPRIGSELCFARSQTKGGYYVYVPTECTDKVLELILNKQR